MNSKQKATFYALMTKLVELYVEYLNATNPHPERCHYFAGKVGNFTQIWFHIQGMEPIRFTVLTAGGAIAPRVAKIYSNDRRYADVPRPGQEKGYVTAINGNAPCVKVYRVTNSRQQAPGVWVEIPETMEFGPGEQAELIDATT